MSGGLGVGSRDGDVRVAVDALVIHLDQSPGHPALPDFSEPFAVDEPDVGDTRRAFILHSECNCRHLETAISVVRRQRIRAGCRNEINSRTRRF